MGAAFTKRSDQQPRSGVVGRVSTTWLGAGPGSEYVAREVDDELAVRLGRDGALVVVTGPPLAGASRTVARAARRMLGSERVVAPGAVSTVDVAGLVAALDGPGVVWLDAAPLAVLDQVTPALLDATRRAGVRVVVTTRPELVGVDHPDPATVTLLVDAAVAIGPLSATEVRGTRHRAGELIGRAVLPGPAAAGFVDPVGWRAVLEPVIASVAATWTVLDVAHPLTPGRLVELTRAVLERMGVGPVGEDAMRDAVAQCVRGPEHGVPVLLTERRDGRRHLRAHSSVLDAAMTGSAPFARSLARTIGDDTSAARFAARTALARGDEVTAVELLRGRPAGGTSPRLAARIAGLALDETTRVAWYREALATDDADLLRTVRARLGALLTDGGDDDVAEARELLAAAVPDQRALVALGTIDQRQGRPDDARTCWVAAAAGPDAGLAAVGAWHAACVDVEAGRDDDAVPLLEHALDGRGALRNGWAGLALARLHRRRGDDDRAEDVLRTVADGADGDWAPCEIDPRDEARFELGRVAEDRGDAAGAVALWKTLPGDPEAVCRLAEHHLRAGSHAEALRELERERPGAPASDVRIEDRWGGHAPDLRAWQAWIAGEVALAQDRRDDARRYFAVARIAPGWRGRRSMLRLAEIAVADGDALAARSWLDVLGDGPCDEVTDAARRLRHDHAGLLGGAPPVADVPPPRRSIDESARVHDRHAG